MTSLCRVILFTVGVCFSTQTFSQRGGGSSALVAGGDHISGGGGAAEQNFSLALLSLERFVSLAVASEAANLSVSEKELLRKIAASLPRELANETLLEFRSEKEERGFFILDGEIRIAKTGFEIGSTIYVNRDLIYPRDVAGNATPLSIPAAARVLLHELGHHQGVKSHTDLDLLASKVESFLHARFVTDVFDPTLVLNAIDHAGFKEFPSLTSVDLSVNVKTGFDSRFFISDAFGTYDVTHNIISGILRVGDAEGSGANRLKGDNCWASSFQKSEKTGYRYSGFHLSGPRWVHSARIKDDVFLFATKAALTLECKGVEGARLTDPGLELLYLVIFELDNGLPRIRFLDNAALQREMVFIADDQDFEFASTMQAVFGVLFGGR